jgi:hypothetical protein
MKYLSRLAAAALVFFALLVFVLLFPALAFWYVVSGRDLSEGVTKYFIGKNLPR